MSEFQTIAAEMTLSLENSAVGSIANNLTTTVEGYALDARQGYELDQKKLDVAKVANNLATVEEGWALDARQGKYLSDTKVGYADVVNDLATDEISKPLSAAQGKALQEGKLNCDHVVNNLTTTAEGYALDARQGKVLADKIKTAAASLAAAGWSGSGPYTQTVSVTGVTASNTVVASPSPASHDAYTECGAYCSAQVDGQLTFTATHMPATALTANVLILN